MLAIRSLTKRYGPVRALEEVSIRFDPGEIHAVLGENGAGKSTLVGILSGFITPDQGEVNLDGKPIRIGNPSECGRLGIRLIHQHFTLVPQFTGEENLALGNLNGLAGRLDLTHLTGRANQIAQDLGWNLPLKERVSTYSVGQQQRLEILRALSLGGDVLLFDEPTAVLSPAEVQDLLGLLRRLRDEGKVVVLIAHKLSEVLAVADRVTVLRKGRWIATRERAEVDAERLVGWMVGEIPPLENPGGAPQDRVVLRTRGLGVLGERGQAAVRDVSLELRAGEILGIGGVDGNGQVELAEALAGIRPFQTGELETYGSLTYIPQDRRRDGLAMGMSVSDNLLLAGLANPSLANGPILLPRRIDAWVRELIERFDIVAGSPRDPISTLSGGNAQKVVVSRALHQVPGVLVALNPTRGLDVRATAYVHQRIREAAQRGCGVVMISTDMDELAAVAARRAFMDRGTLSFGDVRADIIGSEPT